MTSPRITCRACSRKLGAETRPAEPLCFVSMRSSLTRRYANSQCVMCDILFIDDRSVMCDILLNKKLGRYQMAVDRILMIVSDTVRTDMLGYNGGGVRTPNLD